MESKDIKFNQFNKNSYFKNYYSNNNKWPNVLLDSKYKYKNNNNGINAFLNDFPFDLNKKKNESLNNNKTKKLNKIYNL